MNSKTSVGMLTKLSCELCVCQTHADSSSGVTRTQRGMKSKTSVGKYNVYIHTYIRNVIIQ